MLSYINFYYMKEIRHIYSGLSGFLLDPLWNEIRLELELRLVL
jgi:hypothetical protein